MLVILLCILLIRSWCLQMRLNKVSELIHNSTNHQNLDSAGVSVHFQEIVDLVAFLINLVLLLFRLLLLFPYKMG